MAESATSATKRSGGYSSKQVADFAGEIRRLRNETVRVQFSLHELSERLTVSRARTFANEGIGRRLPLVARSALNIFGIFAPDRSAFLSREECDDIAIQLHAFAINVYAIFDNIAWVCMLEAGGNLAPMKIGAFKTELQTFMPAELRAYLSQNQSTEWFNKYGKVYRDSTAHRIAPYLPPRAFTKEEGERWQELHGQAHDALREASRVMPTDQARGHALLDAQVALNREKEQLGSNSLLVALSLTGEGSSPPVYLHPQLLCDWALVIELLWTFDRAMRKHYRWPVPNIPPLQVC